MCLNAFKNNVTTWVYAVFRHVNAHHIAHMLGMGQTFSFTLLHYIGIGALPSGNPQLRGKRGKRLSGSKPMTHAPHPSVVSHFRELF